MVAQALVSSIIVKGDLDKIFKKLHSLLIKMKFKDEISTPPSKMILTRGKKSIFTTDIKKCKTVLAVSLNASKSSDEVDILFDYEFSIQGIFTDGDKAAILGEMSKLHHELFSSSAVDSNVPKFYRDFTKKRK